MAKLVFKNDLKITDIKRAKPGSIRRKARRSKWDKMTVGSYIETEIKNHAKEYGSLANYAKRHGWKISSITDEQGVKRIFRMA